MTEFIITEGIEGYWHYHWSKPEFFTISLCGKQTMQTSLPASLWGTRGHLNERYCKLCDEIRVKNKDEE